MAIQLVAATFWSKVTVLAPLPKLMDLLCMIVTGGMDATPVTAMEAAVAEPFELLAVTEQLRDCWMSAETTV